MVKQKVRMVREGSSLGKTEHVCSHDDHQLN